MDLTSIAKNYNWRELFKSLFWALILAYIFRTLLFEPYSIPSGSMYPNLKEGDYLFVSKFSYGYSSHSSSISIPVFFTEKRLNFRLPFPTQRQFFTSPKRGDIIVFKLPTDPYTNYIKRLIGLPGDEIQMKDSELFINGQKVERQKMGNIMYKGNNKYEEEYSVIRETLPNGTSYNIWIKNNIDTSNFPNSTPVYKVPPQQYFFMGDNRNNSVDSRFLDRVGFVKEEYIVGRPAILLWESSMWSFKFDRFFTTY